MKKSLFNLDFFRGSEAKGHSANLVDTSAFE